MVKEDAERGGIHRAEMCVMGRRSSLSKIKVNSSARNLSRCKVVFVE